RLATTPLASGTRSFAVQASGTRSVAVSPSHRTLSPMAVSNFGSNHDRDGGTTHRVNESQLIARVIAGDRLAGRTLYDTHAPRVFSLAYRLSGDAEKAREFTQDTFIRAFARLSQFRGDAAFSTWLHRIVVTVVSNARR